MFRTGSLTFQEQTLKNTESIRMNLQSHAFAEFDMLIQIVHTNASTQSLHRLSLCSLNFTLPTTLLVVVVLLAKLYFCRTSAKPKRSLEPNAPKTHIALCQVTEGMDIFQVFRPSSTWQVCCYNLTTTSITSLSLPKKWWTYTARFINVIFVP